MAVEAGPQAARVQDLPEPAGVGGEPGRLDRGVLDKGQRPAGARARRHQQPQAGRADLQQRRLIGRVDGPEHVIAVAVCLPAFVQAVKPGGGFGLAAAGEGDEQQRLRVAVQDRPERPVFQLLAGQLEDGPVDQLDGVGLACQRVLGRLDRRLHGREVAHGDHPVPGRGHQLHGRLDDGDQGALGAHHELRQIGSRGPGQAVQPVAARPPPEPREPGGDGLPVTFHQARQLAADGPVERRRGGAGQQLRLGQRAEHRPARVGKHHVEGQHMVDRHAVAHRHAARRVVADHPAERGPVAGGGVGAERRARAGRRPGSAAPAPRRAAPAPVRCPASISMILLMCRDRSITIACPTVWPARLVPAPRGRTGTPNSPAVDTTAATSSASRGNTTPIGSIAYMLASRENRCLL